MSDAEAAAYGQYVGPPSRAELERFFFLDDADRELIAKRRGEVSRLGFALQLTTARFVGRFLPDPLDVPVEVVDYLAAQLDVADPSVVKGYTERRQTAFDHQGEIKTAYGHLRPAQPGPQRRPRPTRPRCRGRRRPAVDAGRPPAM